MKKNLIAFLCISGVFAFAQKIEFLPVFKEKPLELGEKYISDKDTVEIETLKFYISNVEFLKGKKIVHSLKKKHHLLDLGKLGSLKINEENPENGKFDEIRFNIGIDSLTSSSGVFSGDLDPTNGMYWTWQSGYINFKLEGKTNFSTARNHEFQLHIGGFSAADSTLQNVSFPVKNSEILIWIYVDEIISEMVSAKVFHVMSPGKKAGNFSRKIASAFKIDEK